MDNDDIRKARELGRNAAMEKQPRQAINEKMSPILSKYRDVKDYGTLTRAFYDAYDKEAGYVNETHSSDQ